MTNDEDINKASDLLESLFSDMLGDKVKEESNLRKGWKRVLEHIPKDEKTVEKYGYVGEKLAAHSRIIELKNNLLYLETDHPGWIQLFSLYRNKILKGLKKEFPELEIRDFSFMLKGQKIEKKAGLRNVTVEDYEKYLDRTD